MSGGLVGTKLDAADVAAIIAGNALLLLSEEGRAAAVAHLQSTAREQAKELVQARAAGLAPAAEAAAEASLEVAAEVLSV